MVLGVGEGVGKLVLSGGGRSTLGLSTGVGDGEGLLFAFASVYGGGVATVGTWLSSAPVGGEAGTAGDAFGSDVMGGVLEFDAFGLLRSSQKRIPPIANTPIKAKNATFHGFAPLAGGCGRAEAYCGGTGAPGGGSGTFRRCRGSGRYVTSAARSRAFSSSAEGVIGSTIRGGACCVISELRSTGGGGILSTGKGGGAATPGLSASGSLGAGPLSPRTKNVPSTSQ